MQEAFLSGEDFHAVTASKVFNVPLEEVSHLLRSRAKAVNFGIVYGISAFSLAQDIGVRPAEARAYMDSYLAHYSGVKKYMTEVVERAKERGWAETLFGRRRYLPDIHARNATVRALAERNAVNAPIQGTSADIIKLAMIGVARRLREEGLQSRMVLQIHDELLFEAPAREVPQLQALVKDVMENVMRLSVPLIVECSAGINWLEAH